MHNILLSNKHSQRPITCRLSLTYSIVIMSDKERTRSKHRREEKSATSASPSIRKSRTRSSSGDEQSVVSSKDRDLSTSDRSSKKADPEGEHAGSYGSSRLNKLGEKSSAKSVDRERSKSKDRDRERKGRGATSDRGKSSGPESREGSRSRSVRSERRISRKESEKSVDQDSSKRKDRSSRKGGSDGKRDRSKSKGAEPTDRSERSISRNASLKSADRDKPKSRNKSKVSESKQQQLSHAHTVTEDRAESNGQESLEGSIPISFGSDHGTKNSEENDLNNSSITLTPSVRRKRMADFGRSKRLGTKSPGSTKSPNAGKSPGCIKSIENKDDSDRRKSAVSDSLKSFLEDGKGSSTRKARDEVSLGSSISKIERRKSKSIPTGTTASLFGGQVVDNQGGGSRERRRSRSSSECEVTDGSKPKSSGRSRTPSSRTRLTSKRTTTEDFRSKASALGPSGEPLVIRSAPQTKRKVTKAQSPEVQGIPTLSLVETKGAEIKELALDKTVVESTSRIRERQMQRRGSIASQSPRSSSLGALDVRLSSRSKMSLHRSSSSNLDLNFQEEEPCGGDGLSSSLGSLDRSLRDQSRIKIVGGSVVTARIQKDKQKNESNSGKKVKDTTKSKRGSITKSPKRIPSHDEGEEEDLLEKVLGMPKFEKECLDEDSHNSCDIRNDSQASMASLDPSILTSNPEPSKKIRSILELYRGNVEGIEGELELNDSLTHPTQAGSTGTYRLSQLGSPSGLSDAEHRSIGPGSLSPHSSIVSDTNSPGILKRQASETTSDSPSSRSPRVSWLELPFASPGMILLKSADHDGNHENETMASVDSLSTLEDIHDDVAALADAIKLVRKLKSVEHPIPKKNPSLGATLETDRGKLKHRSTDERTVGTANTGTSEATMKTENKAENKAENKSETVKAPRKGKKKEHVLNTSRNDDRPDESSPGSTRKSLRRTENSSTEVKPLKAGSKIRYIKKNDDVLQSPGEPSSQRSQSGSLTKPTLVTTPVSVTKSYLNRRNMVKGEKVKSQRSKSSVMNSLDSFLQRAVDSEETEPIDTRSTQSDGLFKKRTKLLLARRTVSSDDRSVSSAPLLSTRRKRLSSGG